MLLLFFFFSSRRRHTRFDCDWSSDVCSSDLPEAHQLTIYIGWLMHRWPGAIVAGGLFVVPGIISIMALSYVYAAFGSVPAVAAFFFGLKAAVLAIVLQAVHRVGSRALKSRAMLALAALAFICIFF